jgi:hypothetical protein
MVCVPAGREVVKQCMPDCSGIHAISGEAAFRRETRQKKSKILKNLVNSTLLGLEQMKLLFRLNLSRYSQLALTVG